MTLALSMGASYDIASSAVECALGQPTPKYYQHPGILSISGGIANPDYGCDDSD
jgi:hypothetical protein